MFFLCHKHWPSVSELSFWIWVSNNLTFAVSDTLSTKYFGERIQAEQVPACGALVPVWRPKHRTLTRIVFSTQVNLFVELAGFQSCPCPNSRLGQLLLNPLIPSLKFSSVLIILQIKPAFEKSSVCKKHFLEWWSMLENSPRAWAVTVRHTCRASTQPLFKGLTSLMPIYPKDLSAFKHTVLDKFLASLIWLISAFFNKRAAVYYLTAVHLCPFV